MMMANLNQANLNEMSYKLIYPQMNNEFGTLLVLFDMQILTLYLDFGFP